MNTIAFVQLMIVYGKQKNYCKELSNMNKAIASREGRIKVEQQKWINSNKKAATPSHQLPKSFGLLDSKGLTLHEDLDLAR